MIDYTKLLDTLKIIIDCLDKTQPDKSHKHNSDFLWRLEGSANLRLQGLKVNVNDLDITTNNEGIKIFREKLNKYLVKDFYNEKLKGHSLIFNIGGVEVEINTYEWKDILLLDKLVWENINGLTLPILPIKYALQFYTLIGKTEKVRLIEEYLNNTDISNV